MSKQTYKKRLGIGRIASIGLGIVFVVTIVLVVSLTVRVTRGVSRTVETPQHMVRLEILNGCARAGIASEAAKFLVGYPDSNLEVVVIRTGDFSLRKIQKSFIISRVKDKTAAEYLAKVLNLEKSEVTYKQFDNNYKQVSATLVIGEDFVTEPLAKPSDEE